MMGKSGGALIPLFGDGSKSMTKFTEEARKMGVVMNETQLNGALTLDASMDKLNGTLAGVKMQIGLALVPVINDLVTRIQPVIQSVVTWLSNNNELMNKVGELMTSLFNLMGAISPLVAVVVDAGLKFLIFAMDGLKNTADYVTYLIEHFDELKAWFKTNFPLMSSVVSSFSSQINGFLDGIADKIVSVMNALNSAKEFASSVISGASNVIGSVGSSIKSGISSGRAALNSISGKRADGGGVNAGESYLVGEQGMEVFTPSRNGFITPNNELGGTTIINNISGIFGSNAVEELGNKLAKRLMGHVSV